MPLFFQENAYMRVVVPLENLGGKNMRNYSEEEEWEEEEEEEEEW